jgi:hypothetical protein
LQIDCPPHPSSGDLLSTTFDALIAPQRRDAEKSLVKSICYAKLIRRVARFAEREGEGMACVFDKFQAGCVKKGELMPAPPLR